MRRSRSLARSAWARIRTVSPLMTRATISMTVKVMRCSVSETAKDRYGGTKKKSNTATLSTEASAVGTRPARVATTTTPRR